MAGAPTLNLYDVLSEYGTYFLELLCCAGHLVFFVWSSSPSVLPQESLPEFSAGVVSLRRGILGMANVEDLVPEGFLTLIPCGGRFIPWRGPSMVSV